MICVDNNFLVLFIKPEAVPPIDPSTGNLVERVPERIELLKKTWNDAGEVILIPDPVLSEFMMLSDEDPDRVFHLGRFQNSPNYNIKPFDTRAGLELAAMYVKEKSTLSARKAKAFLEIADTKTRLKFDRQIVAIARVQGATAVYSDDKGVRAFCETHGVPVISTYELPLPVPPPEPEPDPQQNLFDISMMVESDQEERQDEQPNQVEPSTPEIRGSSGDHAENEAGTAPADPTGKDGTEKPIEREKAAS